MFLMHDVHIKVAGYENIEAVCPHCGRDIRFNRVTDLQDTEPVGGTEVRCLHADCARSFRIIGDTINARFEMLVYDCYPLLEEKRYAYCILNLAQAYECFFSLFLRVALCYEPQRGQLDLKAMNGDLRRLFDVTSRWTFGDLRNAFAFIVSRYGARIPADEVASCLAELATLKRVRFERSAAAASGAWHDLLSKLWAASISALRNHVVHKVAYRPSRAEVERALAETRSTLFPLANEARINGEDPNWYIHAG
jgi:hypothetical protein